MTITDNDTNVLRHLGIFGFSTSGIVRDLYFPTDKDKSGTRGRLRKLSAASLVRRFNMQVVSESTKDAQRVWTLTQEGALQLSILDADSSWLRWLPPNTGNWQNYAHNVKLTELMVPVRAAIEAQTRIVMSGLCFEHTVINAAEREPHRRFKLYTVTQDVPRKLICHPDVGFQLMVGAYKMAFYVELETGSDGSPNRVCRKKSPGYGTLHSTGKYRLHFPEAQAMRVLYVVPNGWRETMRTEMRGKAGAELCLFAHRSDITRESFLYHTIWVGCDDGPPRPLIRPGHPAATTPETGHPSGVPPRGG